MIGTTQSKEKTGLPKGVTEEDVQAVKTFMANLIQNPKDHEQVRLAALEACKAKMNRSVVLHVAKKDYETGLSVSQLIVEKEGEAPKSTQKAVKEQVQEAITKEATKKTEEALETGKNLMDSLGELGRQAGFQIIDDFVMKLYDFWITWNGHVQELSEENAVLKVALEHALVTVVRPELKQREYKAAVKDALTMMAFNGKIPEPQTLIQYLKTFREEMMS